MNHQDAMIALQAKLQTMQEQAEEERADLARGHLDFGDMDREEFERMVAAENRSSALLDAIDELVKLRQQVEQ